MRKSLILAVAAGVIFSTKIAQSLEQRKQIQAEATRQRYVEFEGGDLLTTTHPTLTSNVKFMNFYPFNDIESISPRSLLFISGEVAHSREFSEDAYRRAAEPKELFIVPGAGHVDLYDRVSLIPFDKLESFFQNSLKL